VSSKPKKCDQGSQQPILWGFTFKDDTKESLSWCIDGISIYEDKNKTLLVPVSVQGSLDKPYVLMSLPSGEPNLHAVDVVDAYNATKIFCFHTNQTTSQETKILMNKAVGKNAKKIEKSKLESSLEMFENDFNSFI
jgi:hypothetical protein